MNHSPAIELKCLSKRFGALVANDGISLAAEKGTIHAIIGENGAGKSTAMKMLYGLYRPDSGEILVDGRAWGTRGRKWKSPADAIACGIGMVHQHFMLAEPESALDNVLLGDEKSRPGWRWLPRFLRPVDFAGARSRLENLSRRYGLPVDWDAPVETLPVGVQQRIEILKLLYREAQVLILDEPTAVLTPQEASELFRHLRGLAREGKTILIITHKLKEVMALADRVTVFRAGKVVGDVRTSETSAAALADMMVGRHVNLKVEAPASPPLGEVVLHVDGLCLEGGASRLLDQISMEVRTGEIVGIAGIEGNGQSELVHVLHHRRRFGASVSGTVEIAAHGLIPEDRLKEGLLVDQSIRDNFLLGLQRRPEFRRGFMVSTSALDRATGQALEEYDVRPRDPQAIAGRLSGGNQQKVVIAREFERKPKLLIASQPTRGVDVGAIEFIHRRIFRARNEGMGVLLVSSELDEILALSDRILVMYGGRIVGHFKRGEATEQALGLCMGGAAISGAAEPVAIRSEAT